MTKEKWKNEQPWGKLRLDPEQELPEEWPYRSNKQFIFVCDCGRRSIVGFGTVSKGSTLSCGKCSYKSKEYWLSQTWGKLKLDPNQELPEEWGAGSSQKFMVACECGRQVALSFYNIASGNSTSCGHCEDKPKEYWLSQRWGLLRIDPTQELLPKEWGSGSSLSLSVICECGNASKKVCFYNLTHVKSCGCIRIGQNEFSPESEVRDFVSSMAADTEPAAWRIPGSRKSYDVYVPSLNLAVEYHGLIWHSEKFQEVDDHAKLLLARARGDRLIQIYSDEWRDKNEIMKGMLRALIQPSAGKRIKPKFEVHYETPKEARAFLDTHHYLGAASGCLTITAVHGESVVGVWVFMKREEGVILWHRACWDHSYRAWNPHEKVLALALPELRSMGFKKMLTFSDNRFHTGNLYEKLGFRFEEEIKPNYYYVDGTKRVSKYALRVKAGVNEVEAAKEKGWYRIWDSGKRRFSMELA